MNQQLANERVVFFNGEIIPESRAVVSFRDRSFKYGDGAFDTTRTFGHTVFKLDEHIRRFYKSLRYLRIDPGISPGEVRSVTEDVLARNLHLLGPDEDYWVTQRISRGVEPAGGDVHTTGGPNLIVECTPLPLKARAHYFRDGIDVMIPSARRASPDALSPRAKTHNYLNLILGHDEVRRQDPDAWAILLDHNGNLCEGLGSNLFLVEDGTLYTPEDRYVLCGVSRQTVIELAEEAGIPVVKTDLDIYDAHAADEVFITSTSFCICPVRSVARVPCATEALPGPMTKLLTERYVELVNFDFVQQYLNHLN